LKFRVALPLLASSVLLAAPASAQWSKANLLEARWGLAATSVGTKALFAGGLNNSGLPSAFVDFYDASTGTWGLMQLSIPRGVLAATTVGTKAMFAGGGDDIGVNPRVRVDIYDDSTGTWSTAKLSKVRTSLAAATVGTKAIFGGGFGPVGNSVDTVDIYDDSTGTWTTATLSAARGDLAATAVGTKVLFAGGWGGGMPSDVVDIYDDSTGNWTTAVLSSPRERLSATTNGNLAIFAGGGDSNLGNSDVVDIYDDSTGIWTTATLSETREFLAATTVAGITIIAGGYNGVGGVTSSTADLLQAGAWSTDNLSAARWGLTATTLGSQAFFAGGAGSDVVDIYSVGGPIGTIYCNPANLNSTGVPAVISAWGSDTATANLVQLTASQLPQNVFGYFLNSDVQGFTPFPPGSNGNLCLSGGIGRHSKQVANSGAAGELVIMVDLTVLPRPSGPHAVVAGETWNFQCWFRDNQGGPTSNFTDGTEILFK